MSDRPQSLAGNAFWAVLDFGLFASAGMVASILLARGVDAHAYGAYAVSFAVYMAVFLLHSAVFAEPMLVLLANRFRGQVNSYLRALLTGHALFSVGVVAGVGLAALFTAEPELRRALFSMSLAAPFMNLAQLMRRTCYALWSTRAATAGAGVYLVLLTAALLALDGLELLGIGTAYTAFAACSLIVSIVWFARSRANAGPDTEPLSFRVVALAHFEFARFGIGTALLGWVPLNVWYVVIPLVSAGAPDLGPSGHLRALVNLVQPMLQVNGAFGTLLLPTFTRLIAANEPSAHWRITVRLTAFSAIYAPALALLGPLANDLLYRGAYPSDALTLWALGAVPMCFAFYSGLRAYCTAREMPDLPLWATTVSAVACVTLGVLLCVWRPLQGAALAMLLGYGVQAGALAYRLTRVSVATSRAPC